MSKEITTHKLTGVNDKLRVAAYDTPTNGGANHNYEIEFRKNDGETVRLFLPFQNGTLNDVGVNGITNEALLAILIDRLEGFQSGQFSCRENAIALTKLQEALHWLQHRTFDRIRRGVEGSYQK